jgi:hypothetical protein
LGLLVVLDGPTKEFAEDEEPVAVDQAVTLGAVLEAVEEAFLAHDAFDEVVVGVTGLHAVFAGQVGLAPLSSTSSRKVWDRPSLSLNSLTSKASPPALKVKRRSDSVVMDCSLQLLPFSPVSVPGPYVDGHPLAQSVSHLLTINRRGRPRTSSQIMNACFRQVN